MCRAVAYSEVALNRRPTLVTFARLLFSAILAARDAFRFSRFRILVSSSVPRLKRHSSSLAQRASLWKERRRPRSPLLRQGTILNTGDKMSNRLVITFNLFALFVVLMLVPIAHAEQWDKKTVVSFSHPIEVPGRVLPAGTYIFKLASSQSDRRIVQIFTQDQRKVLATIQAIPDYRLEATDQTAISFEERPSGKPEAMRNWFYPGDNYGVHFVYPKSAGNPNTEVAAAPETPATPPPMTESTAPMVSQLMSPPALPVLANEEPEPQVLAENTGAQPMQASPAMLPRTAGNYLILPVLGLFLLGSGSAILNRMMRMSSQHSNS